MVAEIKQPVEKKDPGNPPVIETRTKEYTPDSSSLYRTLIFFFLIALAIVLSLSSNRLYLKELSAAGFIVAYVVALQIAERRSKAPAENLKKNSHPEGFASNRFQ